MQNLSDILLNIIGYLLSGAFFAVVSIYLKQVKLSRDMKRAFIRIKLLEEFNKDGRQ